MEDKFLKYFNKVTIFLFLFFFSNSLVKAALSVTTIMAIIGSIYLIKKDKNIIRAVRTNLLPSFKISYWLFFVSILISSILIMDLDSIKKAFKFLYYSLPFWLMLILTYKNFDKSESIIEKALMSSMFIFGVLGIYYLIDLPQGKRLSLLNFGPNALATLLEINLPFIILFTYNILKKTKNLKYKILSFATCLWCFIMLIFTGSRGGIIGFFLGFIFLVFSNFKLKIYYKLNMKLVLLSLIAIIAFSGLAMDKIDFNFTRPYDMERVRLIQSSYNMWLDNKLVGVGLNNWQENYIQKYILPEARERELEFPHNTIAYFFSTSGIIGGFGFIIFTFGMIFFLLNTLKKYPNNIYVQAMLWSFVAFSIHGLVDAGFLMKQGERLLFTLLGITCASVMFEENYINKSK